jgi:hypothetical protein
MLIKHGDGKVLSIVKSSQMDDLSEEELEQARLEKINKIKTIKKSKIVEKPKQ